MRKESMILQSTLKHIDDRSTTTDAQVDELFEVVDEDKSGTISHAEFKRMYGAIKEQVHEEHIKEEMLARSKDRANKRVKLLGCVSGLLLLLMAVMLGGNALLVYALLEATKEVKMGTNNTLMGAGGAAQPVRVASAESHHDGPRLVDSSSSEIVQTAPAMERLPMRIAPMLAIEQLNQVTTIVIRYSRGIGGLTSSFLHAYKVRAFRRYQRYTWSSTPRPATRSSSTAARCTW